MNQTVMNNHVKCKAVAQPAIAGWFRRGLNGGPGQLAVGLGCADPDVEFALPFFCAAPRSTTRGVARLRVTVIGGRAFTTADGPLERPIRGLVRTQPLRLGRKTLLMKKIMNRARMKK